MSNSQPVWPDGKKMLGLDLTTIRGQLTLGFVLGIWGLLWMFAGGIAGSAFPEGSLARSVVQALVSYSVMVVVNLVIGDWLVRGRLSSMWKACWLAAPWRIRMPSALVWVYLIFGPTVAKVIADQLANPIAGSLVILAVIVLPLPLVFLLGWLQETRHAKL